MELISLQYLNNCFKQSFKTFVLFCQGKSITILYPETLILVVFALATITISTLRFKKKIG